MTFPRPFGQAAGCCLTGNSSGPTWMLPVRATLVLAMMWYPRLPGPVPEVALVMLIQLTSLYASQLQATPVVSVMRPSAPVDGTAGRPLGASARLPSEPSCTRENVWEVLVVPAYTIMEPERWSTQVLAATV